MAKRGTGKDSIVAAATRLIRDGGVHEASIANIIAESGTSAGTIYHHFGNKNQVVLAVAHRAVTEPLQEAIAGHAGDGISPAELFMTIVELINSGRLQSELIVNLWAASSNEPGLSAIMREQMVGVRAGVSEQVRRWLVAHGVSFEPEPSHAMLNQQAWGCPAGLFETVRRDHANVPDVGRWPRSKSCDSGDQ